MCQEQGVADQIFPGGCIGVDRNGWTRLCVGNERWCTIIGTKSLLVFPRSDDKRVRNNG
jgi:hypothetical protein